MQTQHQTQFQKQVYNQLKKIPRGKLTTYKLLANSINSKAYRTIGTILKNNPEPIKIPCHRVIKTNNQIGQFKLGQKKKIQLLKKEGIKINMKNKKILNFNEVLFWFKEVNKK